MQANRNLFIRRERLANLGVSVVPCNNNKKEEAWSSMLTSKMRRGARSLTEVKE